MPPQPWTGGTVRKTRNELLQHIAQSGLTATHKALLTEEVAKIDPKHDLLRLDFARQDYQGGSNGVWTVTPII